MRRRPSAATVISLTALFFSLGGAALAAHFTTHSSVVNGQLTVIPPGGHSTAYATCADPTGGGFVASRGLVVNQSLPFAAPIGSPAPAGWLVGAINPTGRHLSLRAYVVCGG